MPDPGKTTGQRRRDRREHGQERRAPVGRPPARRVREGGDDHQREPAAGHRRSAVEALEGGAASCGAHEVESGDERGARTDADDGAREQRELQPRVEQEQAIAHDGGCDRNEGDPLRAHAVGGPTGRELHGEVRDEQARS